MIEFGTWCEIEESDVGHHTLSVLEVRAAERANGCTRIAALVPAHYASEERIAHALDRLNKKAAAKFIRDKLPTTKNIRSGDLGEILATEFIGENTDYEVPIKRLRWKDHRNMAMRGDDVIGLRVDPATHRLRFLKAESKSRTNLHAAVVTEARQALDKDNGLPSAHALSFVSDRLFEAGDYGLVDAIDEAQLKQGIAPQAVEHLLFTFSGNDPTDFLENSLNAYCGGIAQQSVGLQVNQHGTFIADIYEKVIADAEHN